ncbi:MAG: peptidyl-prolyl cis-trans isomerase, partial [Bacteroidota bacterium]
NSASKGGQLPWFSRGKLPLVEFENVAFNLKENGQVSEPFSTSYGWHILKRIDKRELAPLEKMRAELKQKVEKGQRGQAGRSSMINKIKNEYGFSEFTTKNKKGISFPVMDEIISKMDTSYWDGKWSSTKAKGLEKPMFKIGNNTYTQADFAKFLEQRQTKRPKNDLTGVVKIQYNNWVNDRCLALEESMLDKKYPEFKSLMQEYRDGILLFDLLDKKVWSKALKDSVGLNSYYEKTKNNYLWPERADVSLFRFIDEKIAGKVKKLISKNKNEKDILAEINKNTQLNLSVENITYLKKEREIVDNNWKEGVVGPLKDNSDGKLYVLKVNKILPVQPKKLNETKGLVITDYQNYLDKEWINELRGKYKFQVNKEVMNTVGQ